VTLPVLGIDLGTTNSVVAYTDEAGVTQIVADENGDRIIPSVVHFTQDGEYVVGEQAKQWAKVEPARVAGVFKRGMGTRTFMKNDQPFAVDGKEWTPDELSSLVLKKLAGMASKHFGEEAKRAVVTVPWYFGEPERAATRTAGEIAGLDVVQIVNEPTAAAIAHGIDRSPEPGRLLVFDLGGGTFDVTVMSFGPGGEMEVITGSGDRELGGADFDELILDRMIEQVKAEAGTDITADPWMLKDAAASAEQMKKELSTARTTTRPISAGGKPVMFTLTREQFEELLGQQRQLVEDAVLNALDRAEIEGKELTGSLMVGGSSRIPMFQEMLRQITEQEPQITRNLDEDVARGASMIGAKLGGELDPRSELAQRPKPVDAASHALGLTAQNDEGKLQNFVVIPAGTPIPHTAVNTDFVTASENQTQLEVVLNEGDDADLDFVRELDRTEGSFASPVALHHPLKYEIEYTAEQLIRIRAFDGVSGQFLCDLEVKHQGSLSGDEKERARQFLHSAKVQ
jgi:molecular chaperone DnaK